MKLFVGIMHAAFDEARQETLAKLLERVHLKSDDAMYIAEDRTRQGAWSIARACWEQGLTSDADWIIVLNDDALPCEDFVEVARKALAERAAADPVCFFANHARAIEIESGWYTTHDGLVGVGCALHREMAAQFLRWVDAAMSEDFTDDGRINLFAMWCKSLIYTTVPSLVDHQLPDASLVGNAHHPIRKPTVPPAPIMQPIRWDKTSHQPDAKKFSRWTEVPPHFGRFYNSTHWELIFRTHPKSWDLEASYRCARDGKPVSDKPYVMIATPAYQPPELAYLSSVAKTIADLEAHGIDVCHYITNGDSLITRGRQTLVHDFLCSTCTHLLQWDSDVECLDATAVRRMLETGRPIIGGAYPFRDGSGNVVANPSRQAFEEQRMSIRDDHTIEVADVGTGFLLIERRVFLDLQKHHPERLYQADLESHRECPMWTLFNAELEPGPNGRMRYASEDWRFCTLARAAGYEVCIYYTPRFRHWGKQGHEGHVTSAWKMRSDKEAAE